VVVGMKGTFWGVSTQWMGIDNRRGR